MSFDFLHLAVYGILLHSLPLPEERVFIEVCDAMEPTLTQFEVKATNFARFGENRRERERERDTRRLALHFVWTIDRLPTP